MRAMNTRPLSLFMIGLAAIGVANASLKTEVESKSNKICSLMMKKDMKSLEKVLKDYTTTDFKYIEDTMGKPMNFAQMFATMKQGMMMYSKVNKVTSSVVKVDEKKSTGMAVERQSVTATMVGKDKKPHVMVFTGLATETFKKVDGKWLMSVMTMKTESMTMDGKAMPMASVQAK